jgi:Transglycosylase SLT domain
MIEQNCQKFGCNSTQLIRVMMCESSANPRAQNGIYTGLFQFAPATFASYAPKAGLKNGDLYNPEHQIIVASYMFSIGQAGQWSCK